MSDRYPDDVEVAIDAHMERHPDHWPWGERRPWRTKLVGGTRRLMAIAVCRFCGAIAAEQAVGQLERDAGTFDEQRRDGLAQRGDAFHAQALAHVTACAPQWLARFADGTLPS